MLYKVTHCAGKVSINTKLHCGGQEVGTISLYTTDVYYLQPHSVVHTKSG